MSLAKVEATYKTAKELYQFLLDKGQTTYALEVDDSFKKVLLISCASYFETETCSLIIEYAKRTAKDERIIEFLKNKAIKRQYHTLFDWDSKNANKFLSYFGETAKNQVGTCIQKRNMSKSVNDFIIIGRLRNDMVHNNFITNNNMKDYTLDDIFEKFKSALQFLDLLKTNLFA